MLQTQHIVQLLYRKNFALTIIDDDFYCEEADLLGWYDYLMSSIDAWGHVVGLRDSKHALSHTSCVSLGVSASRPL